jgi:hypothetical protein
MTPDLQAARRCPVCGQPVGSPACRANHPYGGAPDLHAALVAKAQKFKRTVYKTQDGIVLDATRTLVRSDLDEMCDGVITLAARIAELERVVEAARR